MGDGARVGVKAEPCRPAVRLRLAGGCCGGDGGRAAGSPGRRASAGMGVYQLVQGGRRLTLPVKGRRAAWLPGRGVSCFGF